MEAKRTPPARPPLRHADDVCGLLDASRAGDRASRDRLVELSMPLVRSLARRYANRGERFEDLVQVGVIGLIEAIDRFDPARGDFFRFAVPTITGEIKHHLRDRTAVIRVPRRVAALPLEASVPGVARPLSLSADLEGISRLEAALALETTFGPSDDRMLLAAGFRTLGPRERRILHLRFFAGLSQDEIAQEVGLSQVQVSRLIRASLERMRAVLDVRVPSATKDKSLAAS